MTTRVLIVGHGAAGTSLAESIRAHGGVVVGYLDDHKVDSEVLGTLADANKVVRSYEIDMIYFAIPSARADRIRDFLAHLEVDRLEIGIIPRTYGIIAKDAVSVEDLTDIDVLDLVGREPVKHDLMTAQNFIKGKRVLITGAAGSIGSRLSTHIAHMEPARVICLDRWENGVFYLEEQLGDSTHVETHICDITDQAHIDQIIAEARPDVVFHAAAYKHVPLMQANAVVAINNNVGGTLNVLEASVRYGVKNVVFVSTDKAVNPVNVMGATKRLGEMMMEAFAQTHPQTIFTAVRFGNVIESDGSVLKTFKRQISRGGPVTVTHEEVSRFFMTIDEASQLIIQSASLGQDREIFVLDMGEPVRILDLAQSLVRITKPGVPISIVGLRPGEKLHEELSYEIDQVQRTGSDKIFIVKGEQQFDPQVLMERVREFVSLARVHALSNDHAISRLRELGFEVQ